MDQSRQPSLRSSLQRSSERTIVSVDQATFDALQLAQDAIRWVHENTPYGAPNQVSQIYQMRTGEPMKGEAIARFNRIRVAFLELTGIDLLRDIFFYDNQNIGVMAGLTLLSGTGQCNFQAASAFAYLAKHATGGTTVKLLELGAVIDASGSQPHTGAGSPLNHFCVAISWDGCQNEVICDPWPISSQSCRKLEYFGSPFNQRSALIAKYGDGIVEHPTIRAYLAAPWSLLNACVITPEDVGRDLVHEAFGSIDSANLPSFST